MSYGSYPPASVGDRIHDVETPALILKEHVFHRNLSKLANVLHTEFPNVHLRAHAKAHKCSSLAKVQVEKYGAIGVCCQKPCEVVAMVEAGIKDVLLTNEVVDVRKVNRMAKAAASHPDARVGICVDDPEIATMIVQRFAAASAKVDLFVETNVGQNRCGVIGVQATVDLVKSVLQIVDSHAGVATLRGMHAYNGRNQHIRSKKDRQATVNMLVVDRVKQILEALQSQCGDRVDCSKLIVTGGGTGTFRTEAKSGVFSEIQAGSYFGMDADYARNEETAKEFENSLFLLSTVMSIRRPEGDDDEGWLVVDVGLKGQSLDSGLPIVSNIHLPFVHLPSGMHWHDVLEYSNPSDEHGILKLKADVSVDDAWKRLFWRSVKSGTVVWLIPGHIDPTVNCHDHMVVVDDSSADNMRVTHVWRIDARSAGL